MPTWVLVWARRFKSPSWRLFFVLLAFVFGVGVHSWIDSPLPSDVLLIVAGGCLLIAVLPLRYSWIVFVSFVAFAFFLGLWRYTVSFPVTTNSIADVIGAAVRVQGTVVHDPEHREARQSIILDDLSVNGEKKANKLIAFLPRYPELQYGDVVSFRCDLKAPQPYDGFRYDRYLLAKGVVATCFSYDVPLVISHNEGAIIRRTLFTLRSEMEAALHRALPDTHARLAAGLLLGVQELPESTEEAFRETGTAHIMAASGYNVGVVLTIMLGGVAYVLERRRAFWFLLIGLIVYVLLAGAEAAVVRAGIMAGVLLLARESGRATTPRNLLVLAAVIMLAVNPRLLRDDVGFQLSMLATVGLAIAAPKISQRLEFVPEAFGLREALSATLAATLFTLPITVWNFGVPSIISPIANLLVLPFIPYAMALSAIAGLAAWIVPSVAPFIGGLAWGFLELMLLIVEALASV